MGLRSSKMNVKHEDCHTNAEIGEFFLAKSTDQKMHQKRLRPRYLKVSRIMVKRTNLPRRGTTREVGGMISASSRKNTVSESRMEMERLT